LYYWFSKPACHFLCLETKKVTKENSRKTDPEQFLKKKFSLPGFPSDQSLQLKIKEVSSSYVFWVNTACAVFRLAFVKAEAVFSQGGIRRYTLSIVSKILRETAFNLNAFNFDS